MNLPVFVGNLCDKMKTRSCFAQCFHNTHTHQMEQTKLNWNFCKIHTIVSFNRGYSVFWKHAIISLYMYAQLKKRFEIYVFISSMYSFSLDLSPIIVCPCHCLTNWLLVSGLDWWDSVCWRCRLKHVDVDIQECVYNRLVTAVSMAIANHVRQQFENSVSTLTYSLQYCLSKLRIIFL